MAKVVDLHDTNTPWRNEKNYNVPHCKMVVKYNPPLLGFGVEDITDSWSLHHALDVDEMLPFSIQKEDIVCESTNQL